MRKIALILAVFAVAAVAAPTAAWAFDCDSKIVDEARKISPADMASVNAAVQNLENQGAEVRVRTVENFGGTSYANLDAYEHALMKFCLSWQAANGHTKNNLVVFLLSYNSGDKIKAGLYYGEAWTSQIGNQWPSLLSQGVGPMVRAGRHGDAVAKALNGIAGFIKPAEVVRQPNVVQAPSTPAGPSVVIDNRKPTNLVGLWYVLGGILLLGIGIALFLLFRSRKREREAAQASQQDAQAVKASCGSKILEYDDASMAVLEAKINAAADAASDEDAAPLRERLAAFKQMVAGATNEFAELQQSKNDPSCNDYGAESYRRIAASYRSVLGALHEADSMKTAVEDGAVRLRKMVGETPDRIAKAKQAVAAAQAQVKSTKDGGYKIPPALQARMDRETTDMDAAISAAEASLASKRHTAAAASAADATKAASVLTASAQEMPDRRADAERSVEALKGSIPVAEAAIKAAKPVLDGIENSYASSSWTTVKDNIDLANAEVASARTDADKAADCVKMETQDWDGAKTYVDAGRNAVERVASLARSVHALKASLETAKREAPGEVESARQEIANARKYVKDNAADLKAGHASEIDAAEKTLNAADAELKKPQPDFLKAIAGAKASHEATDKILAAARSEHEAMERKRQKAKSSVRDAEAAISKTEEYIEDHSGDVGKNARDSLATARRKIENAKSAADLDQIASYGDAAQTTAESALAAAQADYRRREDERQEVARQARERELSRQREIQRQRELELERERERQHDLDVIAAAAAATVAAELGARHRDSSSDFPSFGGGGFSDGGGGSISIDTGSSSDGGGGSISIDSSPSSDGGGGSTDI